MCLELLSNKKAIRGEKNFKSKPSAFSEISGERVHPHRGFSWRFYHAVNYISNLISVYEKQQNLC
ncbi:hypothetical protein ES703_81529 [subsurface metagenome]